MPRNESFEKFYYEKVALGESCGCAEQIIGTRELDGRAPEAGSQEERSGAARSGWRGSLRRLVCLVRGGGPA